MTLDQAGLILTLTDEPGLLLNDGEAAPVFNDAEIAEARAICAAAVAQMFQSRHGMRPQ